MRARLVRKAWRWRWSSTSVHSDVEKKPDLLDIESWVENISFARWKKLLERQGLKAKTGR